MKIYVDMDGVLANFDAACIEPRDENGDPPEMFREGFFRNLQVMPGAQWAIGELLKMPGLDIQIATKPTTKTDWCASEKIGWLREHFPPLIRKINIVTDKLNLMGDYLIDDDLRWIGFQGHMIHFDRLRPEATWKTIVKHFESKCQSIQTQLSLDSLAADQKP